MDFHEIAQKMLGTFVAAGNKERKTEFSRCEDQYVGVISDFSPEVDDFPVRLAADQRPEGQACLILILESPHVKEFSGVPGPAKGTTGDRIRKWLLEVRGFSLLRNYGLILVNAVPYQCSLGFPTRYFGDEIFRAAWQQGGSDEFAERLNCIARNNDRIANCCTLGSFKQHSLRREVQLVIDHMNMPNFLYRRTHPSSWHASKNRRFEWPQP